MFTGIYVTQMMGYEQIRDSYRFITTNAARTLHLGDSYGIEVGRPANFVLYDAPDWYEALNWNAAVVGSYRAGRLIAQSEPARREVHF